MNRPYPESSYPQYNWNYGSQPQQPPVHSEDPSPNPEPDQSQSTPQVPSNPSPYNQYYQNVNYYSNPSSYHNFNYNIPRMG